MPQHTLTETDLAEINSLNLSDARGALAMGRRTRHSVKAEFIAELDVRIAAIADRVCRLEATERNIRRQNAALRKGGR